MWNLLQLSLISVPNSTDVIALGFFSGSVKLERKFIDAMVSTDSFPVSAAHVAHITTVCLARHKFNTSKKVLYQLRCKVLKKEAVVTFIALPVQHLNVEHGGESRTSKEDDVSSWLDQEADA